MQDKSSMMLRLLLNRYHEGTTESVLKGLPEEERRKVLDLPLVSKDVLPALRQPIEAMQHVHYSWLIPQLQSISKRKLRLVISILPEHLATKLCDTLKMTSKPLTLSTPMRSFLRSQLHNAIEFNDVLPVEYLPATEMTRVAKLRKRELVDLIDYLGLYDLAEEIKHIVDRKLLKSLYECLSKKKHIFLRECLHQREKLVTQRLQLEHWDGDCQKLAKLLHHRGMVRLGYALSGQHPDLLWHITHILDTGRGEKLSRYYHKEGIPGVTQALKKQVQIVLKEFNKRERSE
ncbi:MAG: hypothetical protein K940chlam7_01041 [Chlamydiae bacterium]|nr:hypothetical protein [Chlamydiota bacterium]